MGARRASLRRLRALDLLRRPARERGLRGRVQDPLPRGGAPGRPPAAHRPALRAAARAGGRDGRPRGMGAPALVRARRPGATTYSASAAGTGSRRSARSAARSEAASASSTRRALRSSRFPARAPRRSSTACANRLPPSPAVSAWRSSYRARRDRGRRDGGAGRAGRCYVVSAAATESHDLGWLQRYLPEDGSVRLENVTSPHGVLTIAGPRSRELLQRRDTRRPLARGVPVLPLPRLSLARPVLAVRVSYVGELGFELHHRSRAAPPLRRALGGGRGPRPRRLRLPRARVDALREVLPALGRRPSADWSPLQAGLDRFVAWDKGDFVGRDALLRERETGPSHVLSCLVVDADGADAHGYEPVYAGAERPVAYSPPAATATSSSGRSRSHICRRHTPRSARSSRSGSSASGGAQSSRSNRSTTRQRAPSLVSDVTWASTSSSETTSPYFASMS